MTTAVDGTNISCIALYVRILEILLTIDYCKVSANGVFAVVPGSRMISAGISPGLLSSKSIIGETTHVQEAVNRPLGVRSPNHLVHQVSNTLNTTSSASRPPANI